MIIIAVIVFIALYFVTAGYGVFYNKKWGPTVPNKLGWIMMESPVFVVMILLCVFSERSSNVVCLIFLILFEIHYFQRSFVFPFLIRGKSKMPLSVIVMGVVFNVLNAIMQGGWIFYVSPENMYELSWLLSPQFIIGTLIFIVGMIINIHSDYVIRNLREPGDTKHYLPKKGMFKYVTSANYFGEFVEWFGFAILTWSLSGAVFAVWTFANLTPRAAKIYDNYKKEFGDELDTKKVKRIIPFIY
ncbi:MAG: DUF1295 domain-containing protein [Bacteroidales bacterium]|nr:DUF1295 domain-containing protein [Bacteroidales bacterium]